MAATWTTQGERGHPATIRIFTWIALTLGRPIARLLLYPIVLYFVFAGGAARAASRDYLKRVLGREPHLLDGFRHVHCFASVTLDRLYLLNDRHDLFRIDVHGADLMRRVMARTQVNEGRRHARGAIVIGSHIGSFEAVRAGGREQKDLRVSMVMYEDNAQYLSQVFAAINPRLAESIIPLGRVDSMLRVKRALDDGNLIGMLADRMLAEESGNSMREVMLLGSSVAIPTGPFRMAAVLRRPVIFIVGLYRGGNRYEVHYEDLFDFSTVDRHAPVIEAIDNAIDRYVARLEHYCKAAPYNWFNFYDYWNDAAHPGTYQSGRRGGRAT
jgi:predicted LPLAT superfamily acyltransferase